MDEKERRLWKRYKENGDMKAREEIIRQYLPLVKYVAGRVAVNLPQNIDFEDLVSYGIFGLIDAVEKFDPDKGILFKTYAVTRIRGAIYDELRNMDWIPRSIRQKVKNLERAYMELEAVKGNDFTDEDVARVMGIEVEELHKIYREIGGAHLMSLDEFYQLTDEDEVSLGNIVTAREEENPDEIVAKNHLVEELAKVIKALPEKEKAVIYLYYYERLTLKEIGKILNVTESRVSQLHTKALLRLKAHLNQLMEKTGG